MQAAVYRDTVAALADSHGHVTPDSLQRLPYIRASLKETLRSHCIYVVILFCIIVHSGPLVPRRVVLFPFFRIFLLFLLCFPMFYFVLTVQNITVAIAIMLAELSWEWVTDIYRVKNL